MPTTGFPGGATSFGMPVAPGVQSALDLFWGGGKVLWVGNRSGLPASDGSDPTKPLSTLFGTGGALAKLQATTNRGHVIFVLPGHAENVALADTAVDTGAANTFAVVGLGKGAARPTFTWTTATSTWLFDTTNVRLVNLILQMEPTTGTVNVAAPITVSTSGCGIHFCKINCGTDANNKVTIGITTTAGASDFEFTDNIVKGAALATCTTFLRLVGTAATRIERNIITCGTTSAAVGPIQELTTACTDLFIDRNYVHNNAASSTACITAPVAATTGWITNNACRNMTDASNAQIVVTSGDVQLFDNKGVNNSNETAILLGTASV
jgi:hypothetical protein